MEHIQKFKDLNVMVNDIKELSNMYLVYLSDEGFEFDVRVSGGNNYNQIQVYLYKGLSKHDDIREPLFFSWDDVKDHVIPLVSILKKDYNVIGVKFNIFKKDDGTGSAYGKQMDDGWIRGNLTVDVDDIINDKPIDKLYQSVVGISICIDVSNDKKVSKKQSFFRKFIKGFHDKR